MSFASIARGSMTENEKQEMILRELPSNGMLLKYVKKQTREICLIAIKQNWRALQFVRELDKIIIQDAIRYNNMVASLLPPAFHLYAVSININCFQYITKPTFECCQYVIENRPGMITTRPNPPLELCKLAIKKIFEIQATHSYLVQSKLPGSYPPGYAREILSIDYLEGIQVTPPVLAQLQYEAIRLTNGWSFLKYPLDVQQRLLTELLNVNPALYRTVPHLHTPEHIISSSSVERAALTERIERSGGVSPLKMKEILEDPISLEPVESGTVCAFLTDDGKKLHFVGTFETIVNLVYHKFRGSTLDKLFIPIRNAIVPTSLLRWHKVNF